MAKATVVPGKLVVKEVRENPTYVVELSHEEALLLNTLTAYTEIRNPANKSFRDKIRDVFPDYYGVMHVTNDGERMSCIRVVESQKVL